MSLSRRTLLIGLALASLASSSSLAAGPSEQYVIELRVIEGERAKGGDRGDPVVDKRLSGLAKDLQTLPFKSFALKDAHTSLVQDGERVSLEIPGDSRPGKAGKRFLVVAAHGRQAGGKLRFSLGIEAMKFDTLVAVPDGGTIIVGGPRGEGGKVLLFAFTAKAKR
jgi:hypothetical protein